MKWRALVLGLLLTFSMPNVAELSVGAQWAKDALSNYSVYEEFVADTTKPQARILLTTDYSVKEFRVLALSLQEVDAQGKMIFAEKELYKMADLTPQRPLVVTLTFYGDLPHYGISYIDETGHTKKFAIQLSGEDGSLLLGAI